MKPVKIIEANMVVLVYSVDKYKSNKILETTWEGIWKRRSLPKDYFDTAVFLLRSRFLTLNLEKRRKGAGKFDRVSFSQGLNGKVELISWLH